VSVHDVRIELLERRGKPPRGRKKIWEKEWHFDNVQTPSACLASKRAVRKADHNGDKAATANAGGCEEQVFFTAANVLSVVMIDERDTRSHAIILPEASYRDDILLITERTHSKEPVANRLYDALLLSGP
jgi:hypothetical protein